MVSDPVVDWTLVNQMVAPEHQYKDAIDPPLDEIRMAWPFKTEEELRLLTKWFKTHKQQQIEKHKKSVGEALL